MVSTIKIRVPAVVSSTGRFEVAEAGTDRAWDESDWEMLSEAVLSPDEYHSRVPAPTIRRMFLVREVEVPPAPAAVEEVPADVEDVPDAS